MEPIAIFVLGAVVSTVIQAAVLALSARARRWFTRTTIGRRVGRQLAERTHVAVPSDRWSTTIGGLTFPWVVVATGPFPHDRIHSVFSPAEPEYPTVVEALLTETVAGAERGIAAGEPIPADEPGWKLAGFSLRAQQAASSPSLTLSFAPTTRRLMWATELQMDRPIPSEPTHPTLRQLFAADADLRIAPIPEVATFWGIGLVVITGDRRLVLARRADGHAESAGALWPAVGEGGDRRRDPDTSGAPDHFEIARNGALEELGVRISPAELKWLALGASAIECAYGLLGRVDLRMPVAELRERRSVGLAAHAMENTELIDMPFDPDAVVALLNEHGAAVAPFTVAAVVHVLLDGFGYDTTAAAFADARFPVSDARAHGATVG